MAGPRVATRITQHTLWQALCGELPPLALPASPLADATLDSRSVDVGDLFVALRGQETDGHLYIEQAIAKGAAAIICEERGREMLLASDATIVDCTTARCEIITPAPISAKKPVVAYVVNDSVDALQRVGGFQRIHRTNPALRVIGVTGSVGKTTTKEMAASVLRQRFTTFHSPGNLNNEQGLPLALLGLGMEHERVVLEMGMYAVGEIRDLCKLARPHVGVITNIGPSHLSRLGSIERIAEAKSELIQALPTADDGGIAILNWDDDRVRPMADLTNAHIIRYGLTDEADLWADEIESAGLDGIRFCFHHRPTPASRVDSVHMHVPLLGRHSVHTALRAAAVGLGEGLGWEEIATGMQSMPAQLRLVVVRGINGSTVIDDTYNASPASTIAALNLLADLQPTGGGRRVAILGDMLELGHYTEEGHKLVGRRSADVVDTLVTVGELGSAIGEEAASAGLAPDRLHAMTDASAAIDLLKRELRMDDLVLVKGSRAIGMERIMTEITLEENGRDEGDN